MTVKLMDYTYLRETEEKTAVDTHSHVNGWFTNYSMFLDSLFESVYFIGTAKETESDEGLYYAFAQHILIRFPYTVRATCLLIEKGFYFEATSLVRNLYESLFQIRFFHQHQDLINAHVLGKRIRFKTMFEEISPGFYDVFYGKQLSEFAHSGFASLMFRTKYDSATSGNTLMGNAYDEFGASFSLNHLVVLVYGFLNYIPLLFPQYKTLVPEPTEKKRIASLAWLKKAMEDHLGHKPSTQPFYDAVNQLIQIK
jgi:hypothetical protein